MASCLDIFSQPKVENQLVQGKDIIVGTTNAVSAGDPYEINIKSAFNSYIFMPATRLHGCFQVLKINSATGAEEMAAEGDDYSVVNLVNSLFKQCDIYVNSCPVMDQSTGKP